jgi:hypothetical protein
VPVYLTVIVIIYLGIHPRYGIRLAAVLGITDGINEAMKLAFHLPRPYWVSPEVKAYTSIGSFGFPSGAAMCSTVLYGYIASIIRRWWALLACAILLSLTILARIFSGVHFLADVTGGIFFGLVLLFLFLWAIPMVEIWTAGLSRIARILGILLVSALPLALTIPAYRSLEAWQLPASWIATAMVHTGDAIDPAKISEAWQASGILTGCLLGYEYLCGKGRWTPPTRPLQRCAVVVAGIMSVFILFTLMTMVLSLPVKSL